MYIISVMIFNFSIWDFGHPQFLISQFGHPVMEILAKSLVVFLLSDHVCIPGVNGLIIMLIG